MVGRPLGPRADLAFVLALCGIGFWMRATGLSHGLPDIYHPDVPKQISELERFLSGWWVPPESIYPVLWRAFRCAEGSS